MIPPFRELRLDRLSRDFGQLAALKDVSLTVRRGEFVALLGPSGCGKSTTLNCIAGLLPATGGAIWLDDRRIDTLRPEQRGFGMVFQNYALFPHMDVRRNVGFGLMMRRTAKAEAARRVSDAIALVRLQGQEHKLPGQLSGGQQQRVAIARAIVVEPALVLMDEPLSNLDAKLRLEMRAEIRRIHGQLGATTIYVTHDQEEALALADRIVVMQDGAIRQVGTPAELYANPADRQTAQFMGFRNAIAGHVDSVQGNQVEVTSNGARLAGRSPLLPPPQGESRGEGTPASSNLELGAPCHLLTRPDDLVLHDEAPDALQATTLTTEFRGDAHTGFARMDDGTELVFTAPHAVPPGTRIHLAPNPARSLVYPQ